MTSTPFPPENPSEFPPSSTGREGENHPEVEEISALAENLLPVDRCGEVKHHLTQCAPCRETADSLEEIRNALGTLPGPPRMPADIAGRIDAALAAELLLDSTASPESDTHNSRAEARVSRETDSEPAPPSSHGTVAKTSARVSRETRPADNRPGGHPSGSTSPGRPRRRGARPTNRRRRMLLGAVGVVAVLGVGSLGAQSLFSDSEPEQTVLEADSPHNTADDRALHARVQSLLTAQEKQPSSESPKFSTKESPGDNLLREKGSGEGSDAYVPSCVRRSLERSETPLAVDRDAAYGGTSGYLVVLPHPGGGRTVDAYVIDDSCLSEDPPTKGRVLVKRTFPTK
ncbi:anti-sigma factor family protein [Streptomyces sulphureus]|uniref:anti-sigma factor family protein n=1 Tax=Streptomyces sulphureus TaxID=47758 RepID=UPI00037614FA|nr:hypothetical protein [Streptomyces sulphureus]